MNGAERQRVYRERHGERVNAERRAARERERIRELPADARCDCCDEDRAVFLASATSCWNCEHARRVFGCCPHKGVATLT